MSAYSWKALAGSVIGYCMDGFDMLILGFMLAAISAELALTNAQAGSLVTWTLVGAVAGGLIFGTLSDHFGRIRVLTWTILLFAAFTALCAFARGYWDLVAYRVIAGLGLGGEFGIAVHEGGGTIGLLRIINGLGVRQYQHGLGRCERRGAGTERILNGE